MKTLDELSVRALPSDLPREIIVDLSALKTFEDRITVGDLQISDKIEILVEPDTVVAMVDEPRTEEELAALDDAVDADVSKVEGVADKEPADTDDDASTEKNNRWRLYCGRTLQKPAMQSVFVFCAIMGTFYDYEETTLLCGDNGMCHVV